MGVSREHFSNSMNFFHVIKLWTSVTFRSFFRFTFIDFMHYISNELIIHVLSGFVQNDDLHVTVGHCHEPDVSAVEAGKVKCQMRENVRTVRAQPSQVLASAQHAATVDVRAALGRADSVKRNLRRYVITLTYSVYL